MATREFEFPSKSSPGKVYKTLLYDDGTTSCNCRGWTTKKSEKERECVHTRQVEASNPVGSKPKAKAGLVRTAPVAKDEPTYLQRPGLLMVSKPKAKADIVPVAGDIEDVEPMKAGVLKGDDLKAAWMDANRIAEEKLDGARYVLHLLDGPNRMFSRNKSVTDDKRIEKTANVPHLRDMQHDMSGTILDGEITTGTVSKSNDVTRIMGSNSSRAAEVQEAGEFVVYKVFDILKYNGRNLRNLPYRERYEILKAVVKELNSPYIVLPKRATIDKEQFFVNVLAAGGEGVILKDLNAPYEEGVRSLGWAKVKRNKTWNVVCMGFTKGKNAFASTFGAIKFGMYSDDGELKEVGQCSGLPLKLRQEVNANRLKYMGAVLEVTGQEMTEGGRIRHPQFKEWRLDVVPETVTLAEESKSI